MILMCQITGTKTMTFFLICTAGKKTNHYIFCAVVHFVIRIAYNMFLLVLYEMERVFFNVFLHDLT